MPSVARNASGILMRRFAESSSVRSSHCVPEVKAGFSASEMTYLASDVILSLRMGLRLYAIAEDPTCFDSNGSSTSFRCERSLISPENFIALCAIPESTESV